MTIILDEVVTVDAIIIFIKVSYSANWRSESEISVFVSDVFDEQQEGGTSYEPTSSDQSISPHTGVLSHRNGLIYQLPVKGNEDKSS